MEIPDRYVWGFLSAVALLFLKMYLSAGGFFRRGKENGNGNGSNGITYRKMSLGEMYAAMQAVEEIRSNVQETRTDVKDIKDDQRRLEHRVAKLENAQ